MRRALVSMVVAATVALPSSATAIVGGQPASKPYPHMAAMLLGGDLRCGGSLVAPDLVLTAAHCAVDDQGDAPLSTSRVSVLVGRHSLDGRGGEEIPVAAIEVHDRYLSGSGAHDVALLRLVRAATTGAPIALAGPADRERWRAGATATVTGWGATFSAVVVTDGGVDDLREVQLPVRAEDECAVGAVGDYDSSLQLCAGETLGGKDSCQGDSGGPLIVPGAGSADVLVGVVSSGLGCGVPFAYGVYARVGESFLRDWVVARLPAGSPTAAPPPATTPPATTPAPPTPTRLRFGTATRRRNGTLRVTITASKAVRSLVATLSRRSGSQRAVLARTRRSRVTRTATLVLRPKGRLTGALRLELRATGGDGSAVAAAGRLRIRK